MAKVSDTTPDLLNCPICLDLLMDPVAIPCGHSFCLGCIKGFWDQDDQTGVYSCPQCRQSFSPRPVLNKNTMLAELTERLRKTGTQAVPHADSYAGPGEVACDICIGRKRKAVSSCLVCLASYCETHFKSHYESPALKKHKLAEAPLNLQQKICSHHDKLLEVFCRTDQQCICLLCILDQHKGHATLPAVSERADKQKKLGGIKENIKQGIEQRQKELQDLSLYVESVKRSAQAAVQDSEKIFTELILSIKRKHAEVKRQIRAQEEIEISLAEEHQRTLEQEITDLKRKDTELEQLSHTQDHIHFLQNFNNLSTIPRSNKNYSRAKETQFSVEFAKEIVSEMMKLDGELDNLEVVQKSEVFTLWPTEPKSREEFLKYFCPLTLNPNMGQQTLCLESNKKVYVHQQGFGYGYGYQRQDQPCAEQILCYESLSKTSYWEVEIKGEVSIAVTHIEKGNEEKIPKSQFGRKSLSWSLNFSGSSLCFSHNRNNTTLNVHPYPSKIGVFLNHRAGTLCFYSLSGPMTLIHRVQTKFTKPLYVGFRLGPNKSSVQICENPECKM